jgi:hypothetical protein
MGNEQGAGLLWEKTERVTGKHSVYVPLLFVYSFVYHVFPMQLFGLPVLHTFCLDVLAYRSRDSSVGIATGYRLDGRGVGVRVPTETRMFFFYSTASR